MILSMLIEGMPHRSIERTLGVSISTAKTRLVDAGNAGAKYHNKAIRNAEVSRRRPGIAPSLPDPWWKLHEKTPSNLKNHGALDRPFWRSLGQTLLAEPMIRAN